MQTEMSTLKSDSGSLPGFPSHDRLRSPAGLGQQVCSIPILQMGEPEVHVGMATCAGTCGRSDPELRRCAWESTRTAVATHERGSPSFLRLSSTSPSGIPGPTALIPLGPPIQRSTHLSTAPPTPRVPVHLLPRLNPWLLTPGSTPSLFIKPTRSASDPDLLPVWVSEPSW